VTRESALRLYVVAVGIVTILALAAVVRLSDLGASASEGDLLSAAVFGVLCVIASRQKLYYGDSSTIAMGTTPQVAALIALPLPAAVLLVTVAKLVSELSLRFRDGRRWMSVITVNLGGTILANIVAGVSFHLLHGDTLLWAGDVDKLFAIPALVALIVSYHVMDALVVVGAISLSSADSPWAVFRSIFKGVLVPHVSLAFVGIVFALLWHYAKAMSLLIIVPVIFSARSFEAAARLRRETIEAVLRLAESIDYRDTQTSEHSERLAELTRRLCQQLDLIPEHTAEIVLASRVHDLGKIGISNDILLKQGPLTEEQRRLMQDHTTIGANILSSYSAFSASVPIVRHHHERWDGRGYPDGLRGEEIPLGSRIICVADSFEAMTSDRVYRRGMSVDTAVERLKAGMGSQFDPQVCAAFIQMLIEDGSYVPPELEAGPELRLVREQTG
jgi:hypothetical protein